jgi:23S rRNA pseudouridine1911/1915/1917 synthase
MTEPKLSDAILYKSRKYLVAHKPAGINSQVNRADDKSLQDLLEIYVKHKLYIIARLDRPVAGLVLFANDSAAAAALSELIREQKVDKYYLALVEKRPPKKEDHLIHYVSRNAKSRKSLITNKPVSGYKKAELKYELLHSFDNYHLVKVQTVTGRFHQIRVQMAHIGCPIKGDVKYGARRSNGDRSIHLLSYQLEFISPFSEEKVSYTAPIPTTDGLWKAVSELEIFT